MKIYDGHSSRAVADEPDQRPVGIAEYDVATGDVVLTSSGLGSCIGVGLYDPEAEVAGLVHVMLPKREDGRGEPSKFADSGIEQLVEEMTAAGADRSRLIAKIAGGSDMLNFSENGTTIGSRNLEQVRATLSELEVPIEGADVGGQHGRSIQFDAATGELTVTNANRERRTL